MSIVVRGTVNTSGGGGAGGGTESDFDSTFPATGTAVGAKSSDGTAMEALNLDASGNLKVAVTGAGSGGTSSVDGDAYSAGTNSGTALIAAVDDAGTTSVAEDKVGIVRMTPKRAVHANLRALDGTEIGTSGAPVRTDPTGTTSQPVKLEKQLDLDTGGGTDSVSLVAIALPASGGAVTGGTSTNPLRVDPTGTTTQPVSAASLPLPTDASTEATLASIDSKTPALGQQLAAASSPVVLTAAQITTLTPPAALTGFATAAKQDTGNSSLSSIDGKITAVNTGAVVVSSSALPSGAATETTLSALNTKVPAQGQALAAASLPVVLTAAQITTLTPPAAITGFATETTLAAESAKLPATLGQKAMSASMAVVLASDQASIPITVAALPSGAVTNAGTFAVQESGSALTSLQLIDDPVQVLGTATYTETSTKGMVIGVVRRDADTTLVDTTNEIAPLQVDVRGALKVECFSGETLPVSDASGSITVDAPVATPVFVRLSDGSAAITTLPVSIATAPALVASSANIGDVDVLTINGVSPAFGTGTRSASVQRVTIATDDVVPASQSGTWTVQPGNTANTTAWKVDGSAVTQPVSIATNTPVGTVAHDAVDSGAPVKVGSKAIASLKTTTLVSGADRTDNQSDLDGSLLVRVGAPLGDLVSERVSNTDGASTAFTNSAAVASTKFYVTSMAVFRSDSGSTLAYVDFRDGTAGSIKWSMPLPPGGGSIAPPGTVPYFCTSANTALAFDVSSALTTVYISYSGYYSKI